MTNTTFIFKFINTENPDESFTETGNQADMYARFFGILAQLTMRQANLKQITPTHYENDEGSLILNLESLNFNGYQIINYLDDTNIRVVASDFDDAMECVETILDNYNKISGFKINKVALGHWEVTSGDIQIMVLKLRYFSQEELSKLPEYQNSPKPIEAK